MKTPEEIKKGLGFCNMHQCPLLKCPYFNEAYCGEMLNADALAYIQQLEEDRKERDILADAYQRLEREHDAVVKGMREFAARINAGEDVAACEYCSKEFGVCNCNCLSEFEPWGVQEET